MPVVCTSRDGTVAVSVDEVAAVTVAAVPQTVTWLFDVSAKPVPLMTRSAPPAMPTVVGEKLETASEAPCTVVLLVAQPWVGCRTLTACAPDIGGAIVHDSTVAEPLATVHALPPTVTTLFVAVVSKPLPETLSVQLVAPCVLLVHEAEETAGVYELLYE